MWADGTLALLVSFLLVNLLVLLEVADRLSLKGDSRSRARFSSRCCRRHATGGGLEICGITRPANTVGGDFYDVLPLPDGRRHRALGDVAGKGSPAALLMALLLAMLRTLVDEELERAGADRRAERADLPSHARLALHHAVLRRLHPGNRRADLRQRRTEPAAAPPRATGGTSGSRGRRRAGHVRALDLYRRETSLAPGDMLVFYSDGITEAEDPAGRPFEEAGLEQVVDRYARSGPADIGVQVLKAVESHAKASRRIHRRPHHPFSSKRGPGISGRFLA